jgi:hypothetical protein
VSDKRLKSDRGEMVGLTPPTLKSLRENAERTRELIANGYKELAEAEEYLRKTEAEIARMEAAELGPGVTP